MEEIAAFPLYVCILKVINPIVKKLELEIGNEVTIVNLLTRNKIIAKHGNAFSNYKHLNMELQIHFATLTGPCECCGEKESELYYEHHFDNDVTSNTCGDCVKKMAGLEELIRKTWIETYHNTFPQLDDNLSPNCGDDEIIMTIPSNDSTVSQ
jgi:hypothetical protein